MRTAAESDDPSVKPYEDLANLSLARTFYSTGQFDLAVKYFDRVSQESYDWANSLFEASWANFMLKQKGYSKALGNIHTLQAPYFENYIKPESIGEALTVKATIYFYNCLYDRAERPSGSSTRSTRTLFPELKKLVTDGRQRRPVRAGGQDPQGDLGPARADRARRARRSRRPDLGQAVRVRRRARRELKRYEKADAAWKSTNIAQTIFADLTLQQSLAVNEAGDLSRRRLKRLTDELAQLIKRVIKIEYEILHGQKGELERRGHAGAADRSSRPSKRADGIRVDDEHNVWPFTGEYWRDELGLLPREDRQQMEKKRRKARPRPVKRPRRRRRRRVVVHRLKVAARRHQ